MNTADILKLIDAGYTKQEILAMDNTTGADQTGTGAGSDAPVVIDNVSTDTGNAAGSDAGDAAGAADLSTDYAQIVDNLTNKISDLTNIIHEMQIKNALSADSGGPKKVTSEDAVKNFFGMK